MTLGESQLPTRRRHRTDPGACLGDASPNAPDHATNHGTHAIEPAGSATAIVRQAWRILEDQAANLLALCVADEH
jgi:hypothetical protein